MGAAFCRAITAPRADCYTGSSFPPNAVMNLKRWIWLTWLAVVLNALSPVIAHGHPANRGHDSLVLALCSTSGVQGITIDLSSGQPTTHSHFVVPHCVYCAGFAANFALGQFRLPVPPAMAVARVRQSTPALPAFTRHTHRAAQPRGPPALA